MKVLFDFISVQGYINGGAEHTKKVFESIVNSNANVDIWALFDSKKKFVDDTQSIFKDKIDKWIDVNLHKDIGLFIDDNGIDVFYIGIFQRYSKYMLEDIKCKCIVVIHDVIDVEFERNNLHNIYIPIRRTVVKSICHILDVLKSVITGEQIDNFGPLSVFERQKKFLKLENVQIVTVSYFSKKSILYNLPFVRGKKIEVYYAPQKISAAPKKNNLIESIINDNKKYFLLLCADRYSKNATMAMDVFAQLAEEHDDYFIVTTGINKKRFENHIPLPFVDSAELEYVYMNACALLYPSIVEGFGYPPVEAMKYGVPVICSNTSSIPEIVGDVGYYFSPVLRSDLYSTLISFIADYKNGAINRQLFKDRYKYISGLQNNSLQKLVKLVVS